MSSNVKIDKSAGYKRKIKQLQQQLDAERYKNSFSNAILEGGTVIIWAVDRSFKLVSFNQNYFNYFLDKCQNAKIGYVSRNGSVKTMISSTFWKRKYHIALKGESFNFEVQLKGEGKDYWREVYLNPIYSTTGEVMGVSGLAYDITEKMQSKFALMDSEKKFRNIFESFQDLYFRCHLNGELAMLSPSVKEIVGYTEKELLGKNITNFYLYNTKTKTLVKNLVNGSVRNFETELVHKSGKIIPCICNIRIIYENNKRVYIEGVARDITELKKTNEELQRSKELAEKSLRIKEQFLANMSHEIRTPLNGIMGMLHLLDETELDRKQKKHITALKSSSDILLNILNDLLDISKLEAGKMSLRMSEKSTSRIINKVIVLYKQQARDKDISLKYHITNEVPQFILTDDTKLIQVFANLLSNAIKFTRPKGEVTLQLGVDKQLRNGGLMLKATITDNGIGISENDKKRLFKSFTQLDSSSSKLYKGTGLGLYISKQIVTLFKGRIGVNSIENEGSEFWFTFKVTPLDYLHKPAIKRKRETLSHHPKVLIVDDNKVNLELASEMLKSYGCKIVTARSGESAIKKSVTGKFDLILMDIQMPDMDGLEASQKIKSHSADQTPPIIAMTAYSINGNHDKFLGAGMVDYIAKPINPKDLIEKIKTWTRKANGITKFDEKKTEEMETLQVINYDILNALAEHGGKEMVVEALNQFNSECKRQIGECTELVKVKNYKEILNILHTLKGNSGTLGVDKMASAAKKIEDDLKKKKYLNFEADLKMLDQLHSEFKKELKNYKQTNN